MTEELEILNIVTKRLNEADINYMVSGSIAANYYTLPRMTRDIDIVIELEKTDTNKFVGLFHNDFYTDKEMIKNGILHQGMFNLIHNEYIVKVDFIIKGNSSYQQAAFLRRKKVLIENHSMWFISAEDLIISKLLWAKDSLSEIQLKDVQNLIKTADNLDFKYIDNWISQLGLKQVYRKANQ